MTVRSLSVMICEAARLNSSAAAKFPFACASGESARDISIDFPWVCAFAAFVRIGRAAGPQTSMRRFGAPTAAARRL